MAVSVLTTATTATGTNPGAAITGLTHTCTAGSNRLLLLFFGIGDGTDRHSDAAPTYGGQTMTQIGTGVNDANWTGLEIWYLKESGIAAASNTTFTIDFAVGGNAWDQYGAGAVCLQGVDQTTPIDTGSIQTAGASGTSASVTIAIASGNMGVAGVMSDAEGGVTENQTAILETAAIASDTVLAAQYTTSAGSIALSWSQASNGYSVVGFEVNADGGGGVGVSTPSTLTLTGVQ